MTLSRESHIRGRDRDPPQSDGCSESSARWGKKQDCCTCGHTHTRGAITASWTAKEPAWCSSQKLGTLSSPRYLEQHRKAWHCCQRSSPQQSLTLTSNSLTCTTTRTLSMLSQSKWQVEFKDHDKHSHRPVFLPSTAFAFLLVFSCMSNSGSSIIRKNIIPNQWFAAQTIQVRRPLCKLWSKLETVGHSLPETGDKLNGAWLLCQQHHGWYHSNLDSLQWTEKALPDCNYATSLKQVAWSQNLVSIVIRVCVMSCTRRFKCVQNANHLDSTKIWVRSLMIKSCVSLQSAIVVNKFSICSRELCMSAVGFPPLYFRPNKVCQNCGRLTILKLLTICRRETNTESNPEPSIWTFLDF